MSWKSDTEEYKRMSNEYDKIKYSCKCGHKEVIPAFVDKVVCSWCGRYVFKCQKDEFEFRMKNLIKKGV